MTQEEKAQAYDEALNKAKMEINTKGIGETVNLCEQLFPELRESEDENLKNKSGYYKAGKFWKASTLWNATKNKIPQRVSNRYILQECTWNIGNLQDFADEVKNVQEVSLDYPIILDMNGNILDGAHRVVKAYLEGKDVDIVYLGDDEWPEPDYDEEKAVKKSDDEKIRKSLIKFLTDIKEISESGRTSWAVRKEDAEMCKSFIAWLKKQKECVADNSKTSAEEDERIMDTIIEHFKGFSPIKVFGDFDFTSNQILAYLEKMKEQKPIEPGCPQFVFDDMLAIESAMDIVYRKGNEQKLYEALKSLHSRLIDMLDNEQKEQRPNIELIQRSWYMEGYHDREFGQEPKWILKTGEDGPKHELNPRYGQPLAEQRPTEEQLHNLNEAIKGLRMDGCERMADSLHSLYNILTKEQKPAEWREEDEGELQNAIDALEFLGKKGVYKSESGYDAALQAASWLKSLPERFNLQRKVEWSEEDKKMLNHLIDKIQENWHIRMPGGHYFGISNDEKETFSSWLRCLPERFNLPKQEWKEVELEFRGENVKVKRPFFRDDKGREYSTTEQDEDVAWYALRAWCDKKGISLYDLYPKNEWSEEDEEMLEYVIGDVNDAKQLFTTKEAINLCDKEIAWLKSLRPSWKPSKEQMDSLRNTIANTKGYSYSIYLPELYEQLKKLP